MTATTSEWLAAEAWLSSLSASDLPNPPWVLEYTSAGRGTHAIGGPAITVQDNGLFLKSLKRDMGQGHGGPRGRFVLDDLRTLRAKIQ